uniref:Odorant receptor n=1 Tax=Glossina brevipalpis TaxID=37001 RepID=A0A1A9WFQ1_9MUSC
MCVAKIDSWKAFQHHWQLWRYLGVKPPNRNSVWFKPYITYAIFLIISVTLFFPITLIINLIQSKSMIEFCENLYNTITDVNCNIKFLNVFLIRKKLLNINQILKRLDLRAQTQEEINELQKGVNSAKNCFKIIARLYCVAVITSQLVAYLSSERILMYPAWFPWDWRISKRNFLYAFSYQLYALIIQTLENLGSDTYPQAYLAILIAHIKALSLRIKALGNELTRFSNTNDIRIRNEIENHLYRELIGCIIDHKEINELFRVVQESISNTCLVQFFSTGLAQCTIGVYILYVGLDYSKLPNCVAYFCAVTVEIFILCYYGDLFCQANEELTNSIYSCNWVDRRKDFKQAHHILLQRSQKINTIMAGNIIPVNLPTFVTVMKTAYSTFTVLNKVN